MADLLVILHQYTEILTGKRKNYSEVFSGSASKADVAAQFICLASKVYLNCTSYSAARATITPQLIARMKLTKITDMIKSPTAVPKEDRWDYILSKAFTPNFDEEKWLCDLYFQKMLAKKNGKNENKIPKNYLSSENGRERLILITRKILKFEYPVMSPEELYSFASESDFKENIIVAYDLKKAYDKYFTNPVELAHLCLDEEDRRDDLLERESINYETVAMSDWWY